MISKDIRYVKWRMNHHDGRGLGYVTHNSLNIFLRLVIKQICMMNTKDLAYSGITNYMALSKRRK